MCNHCNPENDFNILKNRDNNYPSREIYVFIHLNDLVIETYSSDGRNYSDSVRVNYCPMCGRKLGDLK